MLQGGSAHCFGMTGPQSALLFSFLLILRGMLLNDCHLKENANEIVMILSMRSSPYTIKNAIKTVEHLLSAVVVSDSFFSPVSLPCDAGAPVACKELDMTRAYH